MILSKSKIDSFIETTKKVFQRCRAPVKNGIGFYASSPDSQYPYVYIRDLSLTLNALAELHDYYSAKECCKCLLSFQQKSGEWLQKYTPGGVRKDDIIQEDNTPLAVWAILSYVLHAHDLGFAQEIKKSILGACEFIEKNNFDPKFELVRSHTSIHESEINNGYEIWNNSVTVKALLLTGKLYGINKFITLANKIKESIKKNLTDNGRLIRRLKINGKVDLMPDIILLSPYYFDIFNDKKLLKETLKVVEKLKDPNIHGYHRYLYTSNQKGIVTLFPGPWVFYTAWVAQMYFKLGMKSKAEKNVAWVFDKLQDSGLPEHVITSQTFFRYKSSQIKRFRKLQKVRELKEYAAAGFNEIEKMELIAKKKKIVPYSTPTLWSHIETLRVLKMLGYIREFRAF